MKTNGNKLMMVLAAAAMMTACSNSGEDLYDNTYNEKAVKASYAENFVKKYPNVNLNQSWDFSHKNASYSLGTTPKAGTRAGSGSWSTQDWYEVDNNTLTWMHEQLVEGEDHRGLGSPFYMTIPNNDFYIVPIYQGQASAVWNLHVVIGGVDYTIWGKSQDIEIKDVKNQDWHTVVQPTWFWDWEGTGEGAWWESLFNTDGGDKWTKSPDNGGVLNKVSAVRAKPRKFSGYNVGDDMYFYLEIRTGDENRCNAGDQESSLNGMMLALNCPRPANIPADYETMIIGCEDAHLSLSDWDMNDVVFLVYGKQVPKPIQITEGDPVVNENRIVRYMIEDLGATDDFDFNDIVIDMVESTPKTPVYTNGKLTDWKYGETTQKAVIRHLGGTLPFQLTIGNTTLAEHAGVLGSNPDEEYTVTGWNKNTHNISVRVKQLGSETVYNSVGFPKAGEAPMIIAVDPTQDWMSERQSVPESWFIEAAE